MSIVKIVKIWIDPSGQVFGKVELPKNSVYALLDNGNVIVCPQVPKQYTGGINILWRDTKGVWHKGVASAEHSLMLWKTVYKKQSRINYVSMMKHSRKKKSGGSRPCGSSKTVTDYECAKDGKKLWDFQCPGLFAY